MPHADSPRRRILFVDFWSDHNRGDAAMQIALVDLARETWPDASITVMAAYGANQYPQFLPELDETAPRVDAIVGGLWGTNVPFEDDYLRNRRLRQLRNLSSLLFSILMFPLWILAVRTSAIERLLPAHHRRSVRALREADVILWNGRNFRSDSPKREPYEIAGLLYNPAVAVLSGKRVASIGASVWPLKRSISERWFRSVMGRTYFASFREPESFEYARRLLDGTKCSPVLLPDLSIEALGPYGPDVRPFRELPNQPREIGITVVDWRNSGLEARDAYIESLQALVRFFLRDKDARVRLIPQVTIELEGTDDISRALISVDPARVEMAEGAPTVARLVETYDRLDFLVATRMHSAIFASTRGVPVMTIPYDKGGKWGILTMMGVTDVDTPYDSTTPERLIDKANEVWERRHETREAITAQFPRLVAQVRDNVTVPLERASS